MANVTPDSGFPAGIYRIETTDYATGGEGGIANKQAKQIAGGLNYLKGHTDYHDKKVGSYRDFISMASSMSVDEGATGKLVIVGSSASALTLTLNWILGEVSVGDKIGVTMQGVFTGGPLDGGYVTVTAASATFSVIGGASAGSFRIYSGETADIIFTGTGAFTVIKHQSPYSSVPIGGIIRYKSSVSSSLPGYIACAGDTVFRNSYPILFATIGTAYGAGDGSTTFSLPNLPDHYIRFQ